MEGERERERETGRGRERDDPVLPFCCVTRVTLTHQPKSEKFQGKKEDTG